VTKTFENKNPYYGGECASLNLEELFKHFVKPYDAKAVESKYGPPRRFCVDLVPKFLMANGKVVSMLIQTGVTRYMEFNGVAGSYVVAKSMFSGNCVYRVPVTPAEALKSSLVGPMQKPALIAFAKWLDKYVPPDRSAQTYIEGLSEVDWAKLVEDYYKEHNPDKVGEVAGLLPQYAGRRMVLVSALEKKYGLPLHPITVDVEFGPGPMGIKIEPRKFEGSQSVKVLSAVRVVGFQPNADGSKGAGEASGKISVGDIIAKIGGETVLGLEADAVTKRLVGAPRPAKVTFMRPAEHEQLAAAAAQPDASKYDVKKLTMQQLYDAFGLDVDSQTFIGHAMALETSDAYLSKPAEATVDKIHLYGRSVGRYGQNSPYLYPMYGLSSLPEGFSRLAAIHGGTVMLRTAADEILVDAATGKVAGVRVGETAAAARFVVGDASYFAPSRSKVIKRVVRSICVLQHPIKDTSGGDSAQIILPARLLKRTNDIYISCVSSFHQVATQGVFLCICSTVAETDKPVDELAPAFALLGEIAERFDSVSDVRGPADAKDDGQVVLSGLDETSHFESATDDIMSVYTRIYGKQLDLTEKLVADPPQQE